ncbi:MAG TPA: FemAB family XrtA/PEP-CTERM system-associated protein [Rhizomicrobium sp.]|nr:FemAB family XrtA/PEP-CTERM system-associated protein [Rhizomicrobium sp.]
MQSGADQPATPAISDASLTVRPMEERDAPAWDAFVQSQEAGTFFHRSGWRAIFRDVFALAPRYLIAARGGHIAGILPLVFQKSLLFGNALVAAPFCVEGGPLAADSEADGALVAAALALQAETKAPYIELRSRCAQHAGWTVRKDLYATFSGPLSADDQENLKAIPRKQRAVVRKTLESKLVSEVPDSVDDMFRVYAESVRNLGTPVFAKGYFSRLKKVFGSDCDIVVIRDDGAPASAVLNFYHKDTVLPYYGGGTSGARRNGANDFLYWEVMRRAAARGYRRFDFGRSKAGTGAFAFKKNWGFEPQWLEYEYHFLPGETMPDKNPLNPKYRLFIETWKKLPLPIANFMGPWLIRGLG